MKFDSKSFGARLKQSILARYATQAEAIRKLQSAGLDSFNSSRLAEYVSGEKVPTLERFSQMVTILGLDARVVFPEWFYGSTRVKVRAIKHPGDRRPQCPVARCYGRLDELEGHQGYTKCDRCGQTFPF
jgi:hypothetical protein